jgi:two-component system chemotaxis response regulator CheY
MDKKVFAVVRQNGALPDASAVDMTNIVEDLWDPYVDSSSSLLNELEAAAMDLERGENVAEDAANVRRIMHTLKGEAGMSGLMDVHNLCHEAETAFDELLEKGLAGDMILKVKDWIHDVIEYVNTQDIAEYKHQIDQQRQKERSEKTKIKTLIIEDDQVCSKRLEMLLDDFSECTFAPNGKKGLEMYQASVKKGEPFHLITLDINMPVMDGHETLTAIRDWEVKNNIYGLDGVKVIMTTSQSTSQHVFGAFREGCEAYVVKNFMGEKLLEEMAKLGLLKARTLYSIG